METKSLLINFTHQGYYSNGAYVENMRSISTDMLSVQNAIQSITRTSGITVEMYTWSDASQSWEHIQDIDLTKTVKIQIFDVNNNEIGSATTLPYDTAVNMTSNNANVKAVNAIVTFTISSDDVVNANIHLRPPTSSDEGMYWYCLKYSIQIEYTCKTWIITNNPHSHFEEATIFEPSYPTDSMPSAMWRIDDYHNNKRPWNELMKNVPYNPPPPPPPTPTIDPVEFYDEYNAEYLSALLQKHRRYKVRLELLGYYENVVGEITKDLSREATGQITINNEQITRRSCSLSLINVEKQYLPSQNSALWFNRKFKLWIGIETGEHTYWWSYGVFFTVKATCQGTTVSIQGIDKGGALDGTIKTGMLDAENIIERGTTLTNVIRDTLMWNEFSSPYLNHNTGASTYPVDPIAPIIDTKFNSIVTQNEITINANDYISTLFSSIADGYGADAYYNTNGHMIFQTMADSNRIDGYRFMAHQWEFKDTDEMYANANVDIDLDGYNVVTVYTNESTLENVSYTASNNNPTSPLRIDVAGIRRMTDVEIPYVNVPQDEMQNRCKAYADYLLMKEAMDRMSLTFSCPIIPHLDVNRTIGVTDKRYNLESATFIINSITMPLSAESMTINATQMAWLPDTISIEGGAV